MESSSLTMDQTCPSALEGEIPTTGPPGKSQESSYMFVGHLYIFFGEMYSQVLCLLLNWVIWINSIRYTLYKCFLYRLSFTVLILSIDVQVLNFYKVQFICFYFCVFFGTISKKIIVKSNIMKLFLYVVV